jgi:hypothetical protein
VTDLVFFLKDYPDPKLLTELEWPGETKLIGIGPGNLSSTAFSSLAASLKDADGRILPNLLKKYAPGVEPGRIAFVGFSAAFGLLDPLARNQDDREAISAYLLLDATFDGFGAKHGKPGYVEFGRDAARGDRLLVTTTANTATWDAAAGKPAHLTGNESWELVWNDLEAEGFSESDISARDPMPAPDGGARQLGSLLFWYEYVKSNGESQIAHQDMGKLRRPMLEAYLIPYWRGELGGGGMGKLIAFAMLGGLVWAGAKWLNKRRR